MEKRTFSHELLRELHTNLHELSQGCGISYSILHLYLNGRSEPRISTARKIGRYLDLPVDFIVYPKEKNYEKSAI